jgi:hypothetical protein
MPAAYLKGPAELPHHIPSDPNAGCEGHVQFATPFVAAKVARRLGVRDIYRCTHCGWHHIGDADRHPLGKADL